MATDRNLLDIRRASSTTEDWKRREAIFERVASGKVLTKDDQEWLRKQGLIAWEREGRKVL